MIVGHGIVQTLFVAVFTGIAFICLFNLLDKPKWMDKMFLYLSEHSNNIWLVHMFIYVTYFKSIVFAAKYSILIYIWLIILCLISSYIVKIIYNPIVKLLDMKINKIKLNERSI